MLLLLSLSFPLLLMVFPHVVHPMTYPECVGSCGQGGRCYGPNYLDNKSGVDYECQCAHGYAGANCDQCIAGYFGENCAFPCPSGLWGEGCKNRCVCSLPGSIAANLCYAANGNCICAIGYLRQSDTISQGTGEDCNYICADGHWGQDCGQKCDCQNGAKCNHVDGACICPSEWTGAKCEEPCEKGTAKEGCKFSCDCFSAEQGECDETTGLCQCFPGFMGPRCEWPCPTGFWGAGCHQRCPNCRWCNPTNGTCETIPPIIARFLALQLRQETSSVNVAESKEYEVMPEDHQDGGEVTSKEGNDTIAD